MMPCPRCKDSGRPGYTLAAGNRIYRKCTSCENGFITESMATQDDADREIEKLRKRVAELEARASDLDTEASHLRSAFTKAHVGHDCEGRPCWMRETYERSLKRAEADRRRETAAGKHANCLDNPCPGVFPYCEDKVSP